MFLCCICGVMSLVFNRLALLRIGLGFLACLGPIRWFLDEVADVAFAAGHGAGGFGLFGAFCVEFVGDDPVFVFVDEVEEAEPEFVEVVVGEVAFEEAVLNAQTEVLAGFGDLGQALGVADVVSDEGQHLVVSRGMGFVGELREGFVPPHGFCFLGVLSALGQALGQAGCLWLFSS